MKRLTIVKGFFNNLYPLLLSFGFGLWLDASSGGFSPIEQILVISTYLAVFTGIIQCVLFFIVRDLNKAAILTIVIFLWTISYGAYLGLILQLATDFHLPALPLDWYLAFYCLIGVLGLWLYRALPTVSVVTRFIQSVTVVFFLIALGKDFLQVKSSEALAQKAIDKVSQQNGDIKLSAVYKPDIYYIVLDACAGLDTLHNLYGMQEVEFYNYLKQKGFYVASASESNYDRTLFSIASSLNLNYLNCLSSLLHKDIADCTVFTRLIQRSEVARCLRKLGYKIVNVRSGVSFTESNPWADVNTCNRFGSLLSTTVAQDMSILEGLESRTDLLGHISRAKYSWAFSHINEEQNIKGPKFVFIHILLPHPPFIFKADGSPSLIGNDTKEKNYLEKYRDQITYTFKSSEKMINELLALSKDKLPIIILQGDHGPDMNSQAWPYSEAYLKERFGILNAYFFPGSKRDQLYSTISPVNSFRVLFNLYFQANLPILPDISYYAPLEPPCTWTAWQNKNKKN